ncbi:MAG: glycosyltransferase [Deltaproteobacteria bacterium]|nr:glycosyltransferase [Deltaproteobacteria bacterium]MBW2152197.1 glycosyltransferase [Deltaproteobacteria bacterium]
MAKVSVVIPCYNQGRFLDEAVDSVLAQTFDDFEIIVVNDGSTDPDTIELLSQYDRPKTRVIHTPNRGLASARNTGIQEAKGEYILPLDADDRIGREYLEKAVRILDSDPAVGIVYCMAEFFGQKTGPWDLPDFSLERMLVDNLIFCSGFFRKSDWERVGGYDPNMMYGWEDWDFWLSIIELNRKVIRIPEILFFYRSMENSMIDRMGEEKQVLMRLRIYQKHKRLYRNVRGIEITPTIAQVYAGAGTELNETNSISMIIDGTEKEIEFDVCRFREPRFLRFDPVNDFCVIKISEASVSLADERIVPMDEIENNALLKKADLYLFDSSDPWILYSLPAGEIQKVRFAVEYVALKRDAYQYILENKFSILRDQKTEIRIQRHRVRAQKSHLATQRNLIQAQSKQIQAKDKQIQSQLALIQAKDATIHALGSELASIKSMAIWRLVNLLRLANKTRDTFRKEGFGAAWRKTKFYLERRRGIKSLKAVEGEYDRWVEKNRITDEKRASILREIKGFPYRPKISIVMPVYNVAKVWLQKAIDSVLVQYYENWELCIVDDASTETHIRPLLEKYAAGDARIRVKFLEKNQGISLASNEALAMATGEFFGFLDNDDELTPDALYENVKLLNRHPDADLIYSDEDKLDIDGKRCQPHFKPDWAPDMFLCYMYICHFSLYRKRLLDKIGGFRKGYDGSQDYDLALRVVERTDRIFHIPKVLYHWRQVPGSAAASIHAKDYAIDAAKRALQDYADRNGIDGVVEDGLFKGSFRLRRHIIGMPEVSIIIPFRDQSEALKRCIRSILKKTTYKKYSILLINNCSSEDATLHYLKEISKKPNITILEYNKEFNFSAINNFAVSKTESEYILFLNNDTEIITPDWIEAMLEHAQRQEVGCVGALLYYPDDTVQHGGVIIGPGGVAGHSHLHWRRDSYGYIGRLKVVNNLSAVTAACMMIRRSVFHEVGGFDENITHAFNDIDLCLKIREKGYRVIYTPYAELYHHESLSRGYEDTPEKQERFNREVEYMKKRWGEVIRSGDPYYNPNFSLEADTFLIA